MFPKWFIRPGHSEYRDFWVMKGIEKSYPVSFRLLDDPLSAAVANISYALDSATYKLPLTRPVTLTRSWRELRRAVILPRRYLREVEADVIMTRLLFPMNRVDVPIVLEADFFPFGPAKVRRDIAKFLYIPRELIERSARVRVTHALSLQAFRRLYPEFADKGVVIPHYYPHAEAIAEDAVERKFARFGSPTVKVLFVGNLARLKGLPELVAAYTKLKQRHPGLELTVVSRFDDGSVKLPPEIQPRANIPHAEVYRLMAEAHVFAMPSKQEATGAVYWEAMGQGCALLVPDVSPQRELLGPFGMTADPTSAEDITRTLETMIDQPAVCLQRALRGRETFLAEYHHSVVARKYYELFTSVAGRN
jgi:glycosyltransferase involved in cell wall biosynthesis